MAEPKGGISTFRKYIGDNFVYPAPMIDTKESGKIEMYFEIDSNGKPTNFRVIRETDSNLGISLKTLIEKYGDWAPALINGRKVGYRYSIEVVLKYVNSVGTIEVMGLKSGDFIS
mgnify:CR=1 FL=1